MSRSNTEMARVTDFAKASVIVCVCMCGRECQIHEDETRLLVPCGRACNFPLLEPCRSIPIISLMTSHDERRGGINVKTLALDGLPIGVNESLLVRWKRKLLGRHVVDEAKNEWIDPNVIIGSRPTKACLRWQNTKMDELNFFRGNIIIIF